MNAFRGPYRCPICGQEPVFETTLDLAVHNELTGHLNEIPVLKRVSSHNPMKEQTPRIRIRKTVRVDLGRGFYFEKEVFV